MLPLNVQPSEHFVKSSEDGTIEIVDAFYTIQGEGPFTGRPAIFVRLAGCNLTCFSCDTDYTRHRRKITPIALKNEIIGIIDTKCPDRKKNPMIVFTGGEPFRQPFGNHVRELCYSGLNDIQIETNGTLYQDDFPYPAVHIVCSPKTPRIHPELMKYIKDLKYVVNFGDNFGEVDLDGLPKETLGNHYSSPIAKPWEGFKGRIYIQPCDYKDKKLNEENVRECVRICMEYGYFLSLQIHKELNLP